MLTRVRSHQAVSVAEVLEELGKGQVPEGVLHRGGLGGRRAAIAPETNTVR